MTALTARRPTSPPRDPAPRWAWSRWAWSWWPLVVVVFLVALADRAWPVLRAGGLYGIGPYDDGVHYAAAVGLVHGLSPYRDFLLLQPPGLPVLLTPFALLGRWLGDPAGMAVARVTAMVVGSLTAVLVARWLRPLGLIPAAVGGLCYALFVPAAYAERSTMLEGPSNTLLIVALLAISRARRSGTRARLLLVLAGVALGLTVAIKIWSIVPALLAIVWIAVLHSWRHGLRTLVAAAVTGGVLAAPFLLAAPIAMIQMVITDQVGRPRVDTDAARLIHLTGLSRWELPNHYTVALVVALAVVIVAAALAATVARARLVVLLLLADAVVLISTPSAFLHYGALVAVPLALVLGAAVARILAALRTVIRPAGPRRLTEALVALAVATGLGVWGAPGLGDRFSRAFPAAELRPTAAASAGCIGTDDPATLIQLDLMGRNIERGCPFVIDLSGYSYHPPLIAAGSRHRNLGWQRFALSYLRANDLVTIVRYRAGYGFDDATAAEIRRWPTAARAGTYRLRTPEG